MTTTPHGLPTSRRRRHGRRAALCGLLAAVALVAAACDVPAKPAGGLFDSWKGNDADGAHAFATDQAVDEIFVGHTYSAKAQWAFIKCEGAAGSDYCTWVNNTETSLVLKVVNQFQKVDDAKFVPLDSGVAGRFFHAWRTGNHTTAAQYGTATAVTQLYSATYSGSDHWTPMGCDHTAGSVYCSWENDAGHTTRLHVDVAGGNKVVSVHHG